MINTDPYVQVLVLSPGDAVRVRTRARCAECGRVLDLTDHDDAVEWSTGHECEEA